MGSHGRGAAALLAMVATGSLVTACGSSGSSSPGSGTGSGSSGGKTGVVIKGLDNPFFQAMEQGVNEQAKAQGTSVTVQAASSITDTSGQADKLNAMALQNYACYVVNPISGTNLIQPLVTVQQHHKPIVNIDNPVDPKAASAAGLKIATYVGTNNIDAGKLAAQEMTKLLPSGGQVALIGGIAGDVTSQARLTGFSSGAAGKFSVVQTVAADWDRQKALTAATDVLRAHPGLKGFFVANDDMALGVVRAIADAGKAGQVKVVSVDGIKDALTSIQSGGLSATVSQYPYAIGQMGMEACKAAAEGKSLPGNVTAPIALITKANAAKALSSFPKPFVSYSDPYKSLAG